MFEHANLIAVGAGRRQTIKPIDLLLVKEMGSVIEGRRVI